jgi:hypothetical protein
VGRIREPVPINSWNPLLRFELWIQTTTSPTRPFPQTLDVVSPAMLPFKLQYNGLDRTNRFTITTARKLS